MGDAKNVQLISADDLVEVKPAPDVNLPDIVTEKAFQPKGGEPYMLLYCRPALKYDGPCPLCGCYGREFKSNGYLKQPRHVHDVPVGIMTVDLYLQVPRYVCRDCGGIFAHPFDSVVEGRQCTKRLIDKIRRDCFSRPFSEISAETGYTIPTISNIFDEYIAELDADRPPIVAPEVLGIDEKHIVHKMRAIFVDNKTGLLLEMLPSNNTHEIIETIESMVDYDTNIRVVTMDMANGYKSAVQLCLPNAKIVVDKFHLYHDLGAKLASAKTAIMKDINAQIKNEPNKETADRLADVRNLIVRNAYLFKFSRKELIKRPERIIAMTDACRTFPELNHLRLIKDGFERIYDESKNREQAEQLYAEWEELIPPTGKQQIAVWEKKHSVKASFFKEIASFYRTTKKWHEEIFSYFDEDCAYTNATAEGTNNLIQQINSKGSGYGFNHLRAKALYRYRSGARQIYRLDTSKKPIYETTTHMMTTITSGFPLSPKIIGYETVSSIEVEEQPATKRRLSVLDYVDNDALYYDFPDDETE